MRTRKPTSTCSARVPWRQTRRRLVPFIGHADTLHTCRDEDGADWWSDGNAIFRGAAPAYLRQAYRDAGLPVDVPVQRVPLMLAFARSASATKARSARHLRGHQHALPRHRAGRRIRFQGASPGCTR